MLSAFICLVSRKARKGAKTQRFMFCFEQRLWWSEVDFFLFRAKLAREQRRKGFCFVSSYACGGAKSNCFFGFAQSSQGSKDAKIYVLF
jgi:hypothetical protein